MAAPAPSDIEQENMKLRKKLKIVLTEQKRMETMVQTQFKTIEEEMVKLRNSQNRVLEQSSQGVSAGGAGGSDEVSQLRAALLESERKMKRLLANQAAERDEDAQSQTSTATAGTSATTVTVVDTAAVEALQKQLKEREVELDKAKEVQAKKEAAMREWLETQMKSSEGARERERAELQARITELEGAQSDDVRVKDEQIKKLNKQLAAHSASSKGDQAAAIRQIHTRAANLRAQVSALRKEAVKQKEAITPAIRDIANAIKDQVEAETRRTKDAVKKYRIAVNEKKKLFNQIQEMRGNIRVYCRLRPLQASEGQSVAKNPREGEITVQDMSRGGAGVTKAFQFDRIYGPETRQADVFEDTKPLITSVLDGYNVCIFAYGQTGSGKTFTMNGPPDNPGVNRRALAELYAIAQERREDYDIVIKVSYLEIYNENIYDLLVAAPGGRKDQREKLQIRTVNGVSDVPDVVEEPCTCVDDVMAILERGASNRQTFATDMNEHSSRSHSLLRIAVRTTNLITRLTLVGKLTLVDLAGSERVSKSGATGDRLTEAASINSSLSALGNVISSLSGDAAHVPYRDSKLTHLLQDSLGGNSKTLMFVQVSPSESNVGETLCSLQFAQRVRSVKLQIASVTAEAPDVAAMRAEMAKLQAQLASKS